MVAVADAFWRACAYGWHPRVLAWSLLPLALSALLVGGLAHAFWAPAVDGVLRQLQAWALTGDALRWLDARGPSPLPGLLGPLVVVALGLPVLAVAVLLLVALLAQPAFARLVVRRRFAGLQAGRGAGAARRTGWMLACGAAALLALAASVPLWFVPPLVPVVLPLIWGWLAMRVLGYGALAHHASAVERRFVLRRRRWALRAMGLACGTAALLPALPWLAGAPALALAPQIALGVAALYTMLSAFAACWFAHYVLAELAQLRAGRWRASARAARRRAAAGHGPAAAAPPAVRIDPFLDLPQRALPDPRP